MPLTAKFAGACRGCPTPITPGQSVERTRHGWAHTPCLATALRKENPGAARTSPAYTVVCPTCRAGIDSSCLTAAGKPRSTHPARALAVESTRSPVSGAKRAQRVGRGGDGIPTLKGPQS